LYFFIFDILLFQKLFSFFWSIDLYLCIPFWLFLYFFILLFWNRSINRS